MLELKPQTRMASLSSTSANHPNKQHAVFTPFNPNGGVPFCTQPLQGNGLSHESEPE
jgi:hypothetical protein